MCVMIYCVFVTFPCGVLGQMWYLIVSISDLCLLTYFDTKFELSIDLAVFESNNGFGIDLSSINDLWNSMQSRYPDVDLNVPIISARLLSN